jgi:short-subunit dehydrogenase
VEVLVADSSKLDCMRAVEARISAHSSLEMLVNNAGFGGYMPFVQLDPNKVEELINLKVLAVTRLTRAALPGMISRRLGWIINVSSRLAFSAPLGSAQQPKRATSVGAKAYINTFTQLLQSELEGTGV